jgi:hypothetical protein
MIQDKFKDEIEVITNKLKLPEGFKLSIMSHPHELATSVGIIFDIESGEMLNQHNLTVFSDKFKILFTENAIYTNKVESLEQELQDKNDRIKELEKYKTYYDLNFKMQNGKNIDA